MPIAQYLWDCGYKVIRSGESEEKILRNECQMASHVLSE